MGRIINTNLIIKRDRENRTMMISQPNYIKTILKKFGMSECRPVATPMDSKVNYDKRSEDEEKFDVSTYQQAIGCLTYLSVSSRPDISAAVGVLSKFMSDPSMIHWVAVKRVLRYLKGTRFHGLKFVGNKNDKLVGFSDSDWAGDVATHRSTSGYVFQFGQSTISWCSRRQQTVAKSSTEAEYVALGTSAQEVIWLRRLLADMGIGCVAATKIYEDNQGAIDLSHNPKHHSRTKHIDVAHHFSRELIVTKQIDVEYIPTGENVADIMTKALPRVKFEKFRNAMGVCSCEGG